MPLPKPVLSFLYTPLSVVETDIEPKAANTRFHSCQLPGGVRVVLSPLAVTNLVATQKEITTRIGYCNLVLL
jgi:hypothetical protein